MEILNNFLDSIIYELKKRDISIIYATCSKKLKNFYILFGFEILNSIKINDDEEYLIKYEIK